MIFSIWIGILVCQKCQWIFLSPYLLCFSALTQFLSLTDFLSSRKTKVNLANVQCSLNYSWCYFLVTVRLWGRKKEQIYNLNILTLDGSLLITAFILKIWTQGVKKKMCVVSFSFAGMWLSHRDFSVLASSCCCISIVPSAETVRGFISLLN